MTPWELVKKSEHSHQRAVFAWANCAAIYGFGLAAMSACYELDKRQALFASINGVKPEPVPELAKLFAIHNQGHGDVIRGAQARAEGVKPGVPDIMLPVPRSIPGSGGGSWAPTMRHGLFIELKRPKLMKTSTLAAMAAGVTFAAQDDWAAFLTAQGYQVSVAVGWLEAVNMISVYMGSSVIVT